MRLQVGHVSSRQSSRHIASLGQVSFLFKFLVVHALRTGVAPSIDFSTMLPLVRKVRMPRPRPPSQKWPIASPRQPAQSSRLPQYGSGAKGGSLGPPSGSRERRTTAGVCPTRASAHISRSHPLQCTPTCRTVGSSVGKWPRDDCVPEFVEDLKGSRSGAASGRPGEPVRTVRCQNPEEVGGTTRRGPVWFQSWRKAKVGSQDCKRQPQQPRMRLCHRLFLRSREHKLLTSRRW